MDPRVMQQMTDQQQGQAPQGQPQEGPPFDGFDTNPFEDIMKQLQSNQGAPEDGGSEQGQMVEDDGMPETNQLVRGQNPDNSQNIMGAIQSLQKFVAESTDPNEVATIRSVIALLSRLIEQNQENLASRVGTDQKNLGRHQQMLKAAEMMKKKQVMPIGA